MLLVNGCSFTYGDELEGFHPYGDRAGAHDPRDTHQPHTWAYKLAKHLDIPYTNLACGGNGQDKILRDTMTYLCDNEKPSYMVLLWSDPIRKEAFLEKYDDQEHNVQVKTHISMTQYHEQRYHDLIQSMTPNVAKEFSRHLIYNNKGTFGVDRKTVDMYMTTFCTGMTHQLSKMLAMQTMADALGIKILQGVFHSNVYRELDTCLKRIARSENVSEQVKDWHKWTLDTMGRLRRECRIGISINKTLEEFNAGRHFKRHGHPDEIANTLFAESLFNLFEKSP